MILLIIHILGAIGMFGVGIAAVFKKSTFLRNTMRWGVLFEAATGTLLAVFGGATVGSYCLKIGLYLAFWGIIEVIIHISLQENRQALLEQKER